MNYTEYNGKDLEALKKEALEELNLNEDSCIFKEIENKGSLFKGKTYTLKVYKLQDVADEIKSYLKELLLNMNIEVSFEVKIREPQINIKMFSDKNNILIGKSGQTLKALQTLIRQHIYREINAYPYIILDVENYKEKQNKHLEFLAKKLAKEVLATKQPIVMDNMNSYERRIVHNALTKFKDIDTTSEGVEPNRHIVIKIKES